MKYCVFSNGLLNSVFGLLQPCSSSYKKVFFRFFFHDFLVVEIAMAICYHNIDDFVRLFLVFSLGVQIAHCVWLCLLQMSSQQTFERERKTFRGNYVGPAAAGREQIALKCLNHPVTRCCQMKALHQASGFKSQIHQLTASYVRGAGLSFLGLEFGKKKGLSYSIKQKYVRK